MKRLNLLLFIFIIIFCNSLFAQEIKDKTKYYVKSIENFNNYSSNGWDLWQLQVKNNKELAYFKTMSFDEVRENLKDPEVLKKLETFNKI